MTEREKVLSVLDSLGIKYKLITHPAVHTI